MFFAKTYSMKSQPAEGGDQLAHYLTFEDLPPLKKPVEVDRKVLADLKTVPREDVLEADDLKFESLSKYEKGTPFKLPDGTEVRTIKLEKFEGKGKIGNRVFHASPKLLIRQPRQPRSYFDPDEMQKTAESIAVHGQLEAVQCVPVVFPDGMCRLLIIEGERRFRTILNLKLPRIQLVIKWAKDEMEIYKMAYAINKKVPHTIFETSDFYSNLLNAAINGGMTRTQALEVVSLETTDSIDIIGRYLKLQTISAEAREVLGNKIGLTGAKAIVDAIESVTEGNVDQVALARRIMDVPVFANKGPNVGKIALGAVRAAIATSLSNSGNISHGEQKAIEAKHMLDEIKRGITITRQALLAFAQRHNLAPYMVKKLQVKERNSKSAYGWGEDVEELRRELKFLLEQVITPAMEPPPLAKPRSAPKFKDHLENRMRALGGDQLLERIMRVLAGVSDSEKAIPVTAQKIAEVLTSRGFPVDTTRVSNSMRRLEPLCHLMSFDLEVFETRKRGAGKVRTVSGRTDMNIVNAYRLSWSEGILEHGFGKR